MAEAAAEDDAAGELGYVIPLNARAMVINNRHRTHSHNFDLRTSARPCGLPSETSSAG